MTKPTFSFGDNWQRFLDQLHPAAITSMGRYFGDWLPDGLTGRTFIDVGSGSGLSSLLAWQMGARAVVSFDVDPSSVAATRRLWQRAGEPGNWTVRHGSVLDPTLVSSFGTFDVVLSWGVLHHTGAMWEAIEAASGLVRPGGLLWMALYRRGRAYRRSLAIKRAYNRASPLGKRLLRGSWGTLKVAKMIGTGDLTLSSLRHYHDERGMNWWRDIEDWLGGLPYEVASPGEVHGFLRPRGFALERIEAGEGDGGNDVYLYRREPSSPAGPVPPSPG